MTLAISQLMSQSISGTEIASIALIFTHEVVRKMRTRYFVVRTIREKTNFHAAKILDFYF